MVEYDRNAKETPPKPESVHPICIVGVGGAGSNVLDRITMDRTMDAHLVCVHTDVRVLSRAMAPKKVQLGEDLMRGIGAGGDPDLGREAALFSKELLHEALEGHDIIFVCAGLGGGTGSGAAPVITEIAKSTGALVIVVATMPFTFEGRRRLSQAEESLGQLQKRADALVLFENNRMGELILPKDGIQKAFSQADQLIAQCLRAVSTMISTPGLVKLGLDDLTTALASSQGRCLFGFGEARGQNRGVDALKKALKSPLVDQGRLLHQTENLLVHVAGGDSLTLVEVESVMKQLGRHVPDDTQILFGVAVNPKLGESISVTLISSLGLPQLTAHANAAPPAEMFETPAAAPAKKPATKKPRARKTTQAAAPAPAPAPEPEVKPTPKPEEPVKASESPPPLEPVEEAEFGDELFPVESTASPSPVPEASEESMLFDEEVSAESIPASTPAPKPAAAREAPKVTAKPPEPEEMPPAAPKPVVDETPEPTPLPEAPAPVEGKVTAEVPADEEDDFEPEAMEEDEVFEEEEAPKTSLASVVARSVETVAAGQSAPKLDSQQTFSLGGEDRGRFKDTDQLVVEGEDLDVPTWMRLRKKLKR